MDIAEFAREAGAWLAEHRSEAPRDYGAILPPELGDEGRAWQRRLFDGGFAGIHWPVEHGGRGLPAMLAGIVEQERARFDVPGGPRAQRRSEVLGSGVTDQTTHGRLPEGDGHRQAPRRIAHHRREPPGDRRLVLAGGDAHADEQRPQPRPVAGHGGPDVDVHRQSLARSSPCDGATAT